MSWFGPKLEPGERVVWRLPVPLTGRQWITGLAITSVIIAAILTITVGLGESDIAFFAMLWAILIGLRVLYEVYGWRRTMYAITNRRLLFAPSKYWWSPIEIRLDDIESVSLNADTYFIVVRGGGQEIEFAPELIELAELEQVIKQAKAGTL